jgi:hypothetical protein
MSKINTAAWAAGRYRTIGVRPAAPRSDIVGPTRAAFKGAWQYPSMKHYFLFTPVEHIVR